MAFILRDAACAAPQDEDRPNTFAPEGASRCRALASGFKEPVGGLNNVALVESGGNLVAGGGKVNVAALSLIFLEFPVSGDPDLA